MVVGRLEQRRASCPARRVLDAFLAETGMTISDARTLLAKFGIVADHVDRPVGSLSPGERTRLVLALLMAGGARRTASCSTSRPTTSTCRRSSSSRQALDTFAGTVLLVTHDRTLLANVTRTRTIELAGGRIVADTPMSPAFVVAPAAVDLLGQRRLTRAATAGRGRELVRVAPATVDFVGQRRDTNVARSGGGDAAGTPSRRRVAGAGDVAAGEHAGAGEHGGEGEVDAERGRSATATCGRRARPSPRRCRPSARSRRRRPG